VGKFRDKSEFRNGGNDLAATAIDVTQRKEGGDVKQTRDLADNLDREVFEIS